MARAWRVVRSLRIATVLDRVSEPFRDMGSQRVKNISRPIRVWQWTPEAPVKQDAPEIGDAELVAVHPTQLYESLSAVAIWSGGIKPDPSSNETSPRSRPTRVPGALTTQRADPVQAPSSSILIGSNATST